MRWFCRETAEQEQGPDDSDLPMNNDEASAVSNLLDALEKARDLGEKSIASMCRREAVLILRRGVPEPEEAQIVPIVKP